MKKVSVCFVVLALIFSFSACANAVEDTSQDTKNDTITEKSEKDTNGSPAASSEVTSEETSEVSTEVPTTPTAPQEWVTYEDDSLNATVNDLRAEGFDMEKTNFSEIHSSNNYGYTADLNARVFRLGDTIEVNLSDLMSYNQPVNAQELYEENTLYVCIVEREDYYTPSTEFIMFTTENYTDYTFTLPQDMEPGVYEVMLELNGWAIEICPIVVY